MDAADSITAADIATAVTAGTILYYPNNTQFEDAKLTVARDQFEHKSQISSKAVRYLNTGIELSLEISLSETGAKQIKEVFNTSSIGVVTVVKDNAGKELKGHLIRVQPYVGESVETSGDSDIWFLNGAAVEINNTDLTYGLQTQRQVKVTFRSLPYYPINEDPAVTVYTPTKLEGVRVIVGQLVTPA
jgi:hypothetical protein